MTEAADLLPGQLTIDEIRNLVIVGSGPVDYTAAVDAARANLKPLVIEGVQSGGALMTTTAVPFGLVETGVRVLEQVRACHAGSQHRDAGADADALGMFVSPT